MSDDGQTRDEIEEIVNEEPVQEPVQEAVQEEEEHKAKPVKAKPKAKAKAKPNIKTTKEPVECSAVSRETLDGRGSWPVAPSSPIKEEEPEPVVVAEEKPKK